jgi:signal transduction histidine kinase
MIPAVAESFLMSTLPAERPVSPIAASLRSRPEAPVSPSRRPLILLAEDDHTTRLTLAAKLRRYFDVEAVENGRQALETCLQNPPDVVVSDMMMPELSGFELLDAMRERGLLEDIPVILLTGSTDRENLPEGLSKGAYDYLHKPVEDSELSARIRSALRLQKTQAQLREKVSSLNQALLDLKNAQNQLLQTQKLEAVGQLAAGIAHEINTPTQFIGDNLRFLQDSFSKLEPLFQQCQQFLKDRDSTAPPHSLAPALAEAVAKADLEFLQEEIPEAVAEALVGVERVSKIVSAMKEFSHPGSGKRDLIDLNRAIQSTITVATNEWRYVAEMETDLDPDLPLVPCHPDEINQVVLNLVVNAAHSIADKVEAKEIEKGRIQVSTRIVADDAEIRISDTGCGIPEEIKSRIFNPFFTTKEIGKGTGQGLAITHSVITEKHGGSIEVQSKTGEGTTFVLRLPLENLEGNPGSEEGSS